MHGCDTRSVLVVNAEVDSMGGVGNDTKTSPRRAAIEKVQEELRQEYDVLEERRRELEFLEKGGDPLEFKFGTAVSVSVQSTSLTDQQLDQFVTSEAKGSFAFTASPHGDSVESSGRPGGTQLCEPNSADNLMLFDGENEFIEGERTSRCPGRTNIAPLEQSTQKDGNQNARELGGSAALGAPRKAYKRRNRTRPSRDGAKSNSNDALTRGGHGFSLPSHGGPTDSKGLVSDAEKQWDQNITGQPNSPNGGVTSKTLPSNNQVMVELDSMKAAKPTTDLVKVNQLNDVPDVIFSTDIINNQKDQQSKGVAQEIPIEVAPEGPELLSEKEKLGSGGLESQPCSDKAKVDDLARPRKINGFSSAKGDRKSISNDGQNSSAALAAKALDSESSCTQTSLSLDERNDTEIFTDPRNLDSTGNMKDQSSVPQRTSALESDIVKDVKESKADGICGFVSEECNSLHKNHQENGFGPKPTEEFVRNESSLQNEIKDDVVIEGKESIGPAVSETEGKPSVPISDNSKNQDDNVCNVDHQGSFDSSVPHPSKAAPLVGISTVAHEGQQSEINIKLVTKADEHSILEEARIIEAKRKRITELSAVTTPMESRSKSHWDFVLEEMAWLANDFMQERLWKRTAAAQMSYRAAFTSRLRFQELNDSSKQKMVAHTLAKAVMDFWHSVKGNKKVELQCPRKAFGLTIQDYAMRFLKCNNFDVPDSQAEAPATPERVSDVAIVNMSWEDNLTEENLFYTIPSGATETYRKSIESHVLQCEKTGTIMQEEVETSACDAVADPEFQDYAYEEDEGETTMYDMPVAFDGNKSSRFSQKKRKKHLRTYSGRSYDIGADLSFTQCMENKVGSQQSVPQAKRHTSSLNVSFPTKRVRTCYRQRVLSPFNAGTSGLQVSTKTDASSETSSFQDDQSTLHGGSHVPNNLEVESLGKFEKHLKFDSAEVSMKPKKKKKAKFLGCSYEQRWTADSNFQNEQGDYSRKRLESHQFESNGGSGLFGQHIPKKPKIMRQSLESSFDNISPISGSVPSPAASQMSNMPSSNKFTRMLTGRDLSRKAKSLKMPAGQPGSGSQWSPFEDQALVVLVHDMGPNWELISDAINSTLQFKCIYRKPKECKDRHKILMDKTNGDGADSAEDSGSSQPYPSTLPGIPKGSARQLFQRLQGPVEEDALKSHLEKIILIERKYQLRKTQGDNQDQKPIQQAHSSHINALSQAVPNSPNVILTPLDLCDAPSSSLDNPPLGYQGPHSSGLTVSSQGALGSMPPASGANSATMQGSPNVIHGNNFPSSSSPLNAAVRDGKYAISRSASIPVDEQQRMHHYNQLLPGRNIPISSAPGAFPGPDRGGVRMLPSGNNMGIICGINRGMPTPRPGFQGIASPSMLNSGTMTSSGMVAMPNPVNMHSGVGSSQGNSMLRPRENLHMMRPTQNQDTQRQMMLAELQIQASQVNSQTVPPFGGLTTSYPNQTASPHVPTYPPHHQQAQSPHMLSPHHSHVQGANHATNSQQQTYALHLAKERQLQQRLMQQKQKFGSSNSLIPPVQQHQLPVSSPLQSPQPPVSLSPLTPTSSVPQNQLKHPMLPHGLARSAQSGGSGPTNQLNKQRPHQIQQQQPLQQTSRNHPQQRQPNAKLLKGVGRGNTLMNQNMQIDPSVLNGVSSSSGIQASEKGDQMTNSMQNQGLYPGSAINPVQPTKSSTAPNSKMQQPQQKIYSGQTASSTNPHQQTSHPDNMSKGHGLPTASGSTSPACHQSIPTPVISSSNHQPVPHSQPLMQTQKNLVNQSHPTSKRMVQPNRLMNSEPLNKLHAGESQFNQHTASNTSPIGTMTATARECNNATNAAPVVSSNVSQWKAAEPLFDSIGSVPNTAAGGEHSSQVGQGLRQRQSSGNLSPAGNDASMQWKQPSHLQTHSPVHQPQQQL
nr:chromatin modification-related protein EAF1 B-like isoform X1 [Ipomoea batatas]